MDDHKLSLIVPAFNEERTIEAVLDRIFRFLPDVHEVLVIDDGSVDRTPELSHEYANQDKRVKLFRHKTNLGKTAALRTGLAACTGSIVVVQDAERGPELPRVYQRIAGANEANAESHLATHQPIGERVTLSRSLMARGNLFARLSGFSRTRRREFGRLTPTLNPGNCSLDRLHRADSNCARHHEAFS